MIGAARGIPLACALAIACAGCTYDYARFSMVSVLPMHAVDLPPELWMDLLADRVGGAASAAVADASTATPRATSTRVRTRKSVPLWPS